MTLPYREQDPDDVQTLAAATTVPARTRSALGDLLAEVNAIADPDEALAFAHDAGAALHALRDAIIHRQVLGAGRNPKDVARRHDLSMSVILMACR